VSAHQFGGNGKPDGAGHCHGQQRIFADRGRAVQVESAGGRPNALWFAPEHWCLEDRGPQCTLPVFIDDATGRLMHVQFVESKSISKPPGQAGGFLQRQARRLSR